MASLKSQRNTEPQRRDDDLRNQARGLRRRHSPASALLMFQRRPGLMVFTPVVAPRWRERGEMAASGVARPLVSETVCTRHAKSRCKTAASAVLVLTVSGILLAADSAGRRASSLGPLFARSRVVDLTGPRRDGSLTVTAGGQLFLLQPSGALPSFARGPGGYATDPGAEAYLALARRRRVPGAQCAFRRDDVYALEVTPPGVVVVDASGRARPVAALPAGTFPNGITFDAVGRFGRRLLVTAGSNGATNVYAIDRRGPAAHGRPASTPGGGRHRGCPEFLRWLRRPADGAGRGRRRPRGDRCRAVGRARSSTPVSPPAATSGSRASASSRRASTHAARRFLRIGARRATRTRHGQHPHDHRIGAHRRWCARGRSAGGNRGGSGHDRCPLPPHVHGPPHRRRARGSSCRGAHRLRATGWSIGRSGCWALTRGTARRASRPCLQGLEPDLRNNLAHESILAFPGGSSRALYPVRKEAEGLEL